MQKRKLTLGHSPDPDDAFMFYGLASHQVDSRGWEFEHILQDIQTLNERAQREELDITAVSIHAFAYISDKYALLSSGASMGDNYGPMVVAREALPLDVLTTKSIAIPGTMTSAFLALNLAIGKFNYQVVPFDEILERVAAGEHDAGLIIHEGQLTYKELGLNKVLDLGEWWMNRHQLPLPLGGNVVRRALGEQAIKELGEILRESIQFGLDHREEAVRHSLQWARGMGHELADEFVGMYVNDYTLDYGDKGRRAVEMFLSEAAQAGIIPKKPDIAFVG
ncbi:MAG: MqnA/MqnD/SBP family protein [Candidatus Sumerlaeaceae bacterium]